MKVFTMKYHYQNIGHAQHVTGVLSGSKLTTFALFVYTGIIANTCLRKTF